MKKRTIIYCSFIITALLMTGCGGNRGNEQTPPSSSAAQDTSSPETDTSAAGKTSESASQESKTTASMITEAEAKEIALAHADLVIEEVTFSKCELDREPETAHYDIEFHTEDQLEYDYDIDAHTGKIISYEWDEDELFVD